MYFSFDERRDAFAVEKGAGIMDDLVVEMIE